MSSPAVSWREGMEGPLNVVYKVLTAAEWADMERDGVFRGSADDRRDGFIHLSSADQLQGTLDKHFAGASDLVLAAVAADRIAERLEWEAGRNGELFPHLYGPLPAAAVRWVRALEGGAAPPLAELE